jgi:hypothetical protein
MHPFAAPSHPHSSHQPSPTVPPPGSLAGLLSPPESRRTSGDEKEMPRPTARQSLPSIHEALSSEQSIPYPGPAPPPIPSTAAAAHQYPPPAATTSPSDPRMRPPNDPSGSQGPPNPFSQTASPFVGTSTSQTSAPPPPPPPGHHDPYARAPPEQRPPYSTLQHNPTKLPSLHPIKTTQSPPPPPARSYPQYPPAPPPAYENTAPRAAEPVGHHYAYPQYPPTYPPSALPPGPPGPPGSAYLPTSTYPPSRYPGQWRDAEPPRMEDKKLNRASLAPYGESVKRHLESFDLEASLNEVGNTPTTFRT